MAEENSMIRVGKVSDVNNSALKARVFYPGMGNMVSDWLPVLQFPGMTTNYAGSHKHTSPEETNSAGGHSHTTDKWMPKVNDKVLVIMEYGFNSSGYVAGVIP